jgi:formate dehydrogenase major subunit
VTAPIKVTLDGRELEAKPGQSILDVARANGVDIPTLCHDPRLPAQGACLLCAVEVAGANKLLLACATEVRPGMVVQTRSERVVGARRSVLELLLSIHYADCKGPCHVACPAGIDVQGYLALARAGRDDEALALIRERNPLPSICGRVCVRHCEANCHRIKVDDAVGVNLVKRYLADAAVGRLPKPVPAKPSGHRVAVVGGGPGGLSAAWFLARRGHAVTIFDAHPKLGGTVRYGIPDYRLPQEVIDAEVQYILDHGVKARTGVRLGKDFTLESLKGEGFEAILLALGAMKAKPMQVTNEDTPGVLGGIDFLARVKLEGPPKLEGHVVVVGGGNTAIDAARTAARCGAAKVTILYRRTRAEMPADPAEVEDALEEGIALELLVAPKEVVAENGHVKALRCQRMQLGEPDASGRRRPVPIPGSTQDVECTAIIAAIGQDVDLSGATAPAATKWGTLKADDKTTVTSVPGVFATGDAVSGPAAAIDAIGGGRRAAVAIDVYLETGGLQVGAPEFVSRKTLLGEVPEGSLAHVAKRPRAEMPKVTPAVRVHNWEEVDLGLSVEAARAETLRCLSCGCSAISTCKLKEYAQEYQADQTRLTGKVRKHEVDNRHPLITMDANKCILCGRCIRQCTDLQGVAALGFLLRGFDAMVRPSLDKPLQESGCISCGNCIEVCPTGAIDYRQLFEQPRAGLAEPHASVCSYCGVGCGVQFNVKYGDFWHVTSRWQGAHTPGELCERGRFGHQYLDQSRRLTAPAVQQKAADLDAALKQAVAGLKGVAERHGAESLAFLCSPRATNEEVHLVQRLAREGFGCNNVASLFHLAHPVDDGLARAFGANASTVTLDDVDRADVIVAVNGDVSAEHPVLGFHLQRAVKRGAALIAIASTETALPGAMRLAARRGTAAALLRAVAAEVAQAQGDGSARAEGFPAFLKQCEQDLASVEAVTSIAPATVKQLAALMADTTHRVVFVYDADAALEHAPGDLAAIAGLLLTTGRVGQAGDGVLVTRHHANGQGFLDLGGLPELAPAGAKLKGARTLEELRQAFEAGTIKGLLVMGEDATSDPAFVGVLAAAEHVVAIDAFATETTRAAHVALPGTAYAESAGSVTSMDRHVQAFAPAFKAPAGLTGFDVLARLLAQATNGAPLTLAQARAQIAAAHPAYAKLADLKDSEGFTWSLVVNGSARFVTAPADGALRYRRASFSSIDAFFARQHQRLLPNLPA